MAVLDAVGRNVVAVVTIEYDFDLKDYRSVFTDLGIDQKR